MTAVGVGGEFLHDCSECVSLGDDLYVCPKAGYSHATGPSLVARYGDAPSAYLSVPWSVLQEAGGDPRLGEAANRAIARVVGDGSVLRAVFSRYVGEHGSRLDALGVEATTAVRVANGDVPWGRVLEVLHLAAVMDVSGNVTVSVRGGA